MEVRSSERIDILSSATRLWQGAIPPLLSALIAIFSQDVWSKQSVAIICLVISFIALIDGIWMIRSYDKKQEDALKKEMANLESKADSLDKKLRDANNELDAKNSDLKKCERYTTDLNSQINDLKKEVQQLETELDEAKDELNKLNDKKLQYEANVKDKIYGLTKNDLLGLSIIYRTGSLSLGYSDDAEVYSPESFALVKFSLCFVKKDYRDKDGYHIVIEMIPRVRTVINQDEDLRSLLTQVKSD